jgi:hypothetical protein
MSLLRRAVVPLLGNILIIAHFYIKLSTTRIEWTKRASL